MQPEYLSTTDTLIYLTTRTLSGFPDSMPDIPEPKGPFDSTTEDLLYNLLQAAKTGGGGGGGGGPITATMVSTTIAGQTFTNQQQVNDALFYSAPSVTSFTTNLGTQMRGATVTNLTLSWATNKAVVSQSINQGIGAIPAADRSKVLSGLNITANTTWTITVNDGTNSASRNATLSFANEKRWGVAPLGTDAAVIAALTGNDLLASESRAKVFTVNAGTNDYIWYFLPVRLGLPTFIIGGFEESFPNTIVSHTNAAGFTENYYLCRSLNKGLGNTTVTAQ